RFAPDGQEIVLSGDEPEEGPPRVGGAVFGPVRWHAADSGKLIREQRLASRARLITPSPDWSRLAVATQEVRDEDGGPPAIRLLDAKTGAETGHFDLEPTGWETVALAWSADGRSLFTATSKKVIQTDAATLKTIAEIKLPHFRLEPATKTPMESGLYRGAFVRHGTEILTAGDMAEFYGWRLMGGERLWAVKTDGQHFRVLLPSPDERLLAAVCIAADKSAKLRLFDLASRRNIATFDLGRDHADRLAFSPDGSKLLAGCYDGTALVFDVSDL
ncbi:MAG TPA: hypothetical protein VFB80_13520, partial [Pirellulaceae bacterium]|nr:hypothetical protein [Pirellulaceae bacterium]